MDLDVCVACTEANYGEPVAWPLCTQRSVDEALEAAAVELDTCGITFEDEDFPNVPQAVRGTLARAARIVRSRKGATT
jgi:hypothetical protein